MYNNDGEEVVHFRIEGENTDDEGIVSTALQRQLASEKNDMVFLLDAADLDDEDETGGINNSIMPADWEDVYYDEEYTEFLQEADLETLRNLFATAYKMQADPSISWKLDIVSSIDARITFLLNRIYSFTDFVDQCDPSIKATTSLEKSTIDEVGIMPFLHKLFKKMRAQPMDIKVEQPSPKSCKLARFSQEYAAIDVPLEKCKENKSADAGTALLSMLFGAKGGMSPLESSVRHAVCIRSDYNYVPCISKSSFNGRSVALNCIDGLLHPHYGYVKYMHVESKEKNKLVTFSPKLFDSQFELHLHDNMLWVSGDQRIKGYDISSESDSPTCKYTLFSGEASPMLIFPRNTLFAGCNNSILKFWRVDLLDRHQDIFHSNKDLFDPKALIDLPETASFVSNADTIELSKGHQHDGQTTVEETSKGITQLCYLFGAVEEHTSMIVYQEHSYSFKIFDIHAEKISRYLLGHTNYVEKIATNCLLPYIIASASKDSTAKIWDSRSSQCVLTLGGNCSRELLAVDIASISGAPYAFTGGKDEGIKVWDLRTQTCLYELSCGNNVVRDLYWSNGTNSLTVVSQCGNIAGQQEGSGQSGTETISWPLDALHYKTDFEEVWNAGETCVWRYQFTDER